MQIKIGYAIFFGITYFPGMPIFNLCRPNVIKTYVVVVTFVIFIYCYFLHLHVSYLVYFEA